MTKPRCCAAYDVRPLFTMFSGTCFKCCSLPSLTAYHRGGVSYNVQFIITHSHHILAKTKVLIFNLDAQLTLMYFSGYFWLIPCLLPRAAIIVEMKVSVGICNVQRGCGGCGVGVVGWQKRISWANSSLILLPPLRKGLLLFPIVICPFPDQVGYKKRLKKKNMHIFLSVYSSRNSTIGEMWFFRTVPHNISISCWCCAFRGGGIALCEVLPWVACLFAAEEE